MSASNETELVACLNQRQFKSLIYRESDWLITLDNNMTVMIECLWRLIDAGRVKWTSLDHDQWFGLSAPVDAAAEVNKRIAGHVVKRVELRAGTLDLELYFDHGFSFQVIPYSGSYEAWNVDGPSGWFIATGGGDLKRVRKGN